MTSRWNSPRLRRWARRLGYAVLGGVVLTIALLAAFEIVVLCGSYPTGRLAARPQSFRVRDAEGRLLREAVDARGMRAEWVTLAAISPHVIAATVAVEDERFRSHDGVDGEGVARALLTNLRAGRFREGASTLTMQLARLVKPRAKTLRGKLAEMIDARRIERALSKDDILEQYLNRAPYGAGTVGIEAASRRFFGKPSAHLSLAEATLLAGLPNAPSELNPLRRFEAAKGRQRVVLRRLLSRGCITRAEHDAALVEPLALVKTAPPAALHFTDWVLGLRPGGGDVATTLDGALQADAERILAEHVRTLAASGLTNAAAVILDNQRCEVLAMVGSADYHDGDGGAVNGALATRQPGSALKPFTYALAFEDGDTPATVVPDVETKYGDPAGALFSPQNYTKRFVGPVLMGDALAMSLNVPAIRVAQRVGVAPLLERLRALGMTSLSRPASYYGLGLTLGNGEVTLLELAQAYAALARGGIACHATPFPAAGAGAAPADDARVFSPEIAYLISDVLSDDSLRASAFGPANALMLPFPIAVKTGTSSNFRDNWAIGYTQRYTIAVWAGDFGGDSMNRLAGVSGAGPLFAKLATRTIDRDPPQLAPRPFAAPESIAEVTVCALSGQRPGPHCPHTRSVHVPAAGLPEDQCPFHRELAIDKRNGLLAGARCPARFVDHRVVEALPAVYARWQEEAGGSQPPTHYSPLCPADGPIAGALVITYPREGEVFLIEPGYDRRTQTLPMTAEVDPPLANVTWLIDGKPYATAEWPYQTSWPLAPGKHRLEVTAHGHRSDPIAFEVR